jgi:TRAF3-interacting protein 1
MTDAELAKSIKQTQELLGKYVKKPPLSEKNLSRPPFRFLHDVTTSVSIITYNAHISSKIEVVK